jgi:hypothetical protein
MSKVKIIKLNESMEFSNNKTTLGLLHEPSDESDIDELETDTYIDRSEFDSAFDFFSNDDYACVIDMMIKTNFDSNQYHTFNRYDDLHRLIGTIWPQEIIISNSYDLNDLKYFILNVGGTVIWQIPIPFILKLFPPTMIDSKYHIHIPKTYFLHHYTHCIFNFLKNSAGTKTIPNKFIDRANKKKIFGLPICLFHIHETHFKLETTNSIKYDLTIETTYFNYDNLKSTTDVHTGLRFDVNLIHEIVLTNPPLK